MSRTRRLTLYAIACLPVLAGMVLVEFAEPFPADWLNPDNPHYWANVLRALAFLLGGVVLGMIAYVMAKSIAAETKVSGGHPRVKLYNHVTLVALGHGVLMVTLLFYIRERVNQPLSPATPVAISGLALTIFALSQMLSYQNSRLRKFHSAKQVLGAISRDTSDDDAQLSMTVYGSTEQMHLDRWLDSFDTGELVRLTVEKVEEQGDGDDSGFFHRRIWRRRR